MDILDNTAIEDPYEALKARLVGTYTPGPWQQADQLLDHPSLGDRKPSQRLATMLALRDQQEKPGMLFFSLFCRPLP